MNTIPVFRPHSTRNPHADTAHKQFGAFRRWLYRALGRPLIAQVPEQPRLAQRLRIKNPRLYIAWRRASNETRARMKLKHRQQLLAFARFLDRCALRVRMYVKASTPKRKRTAQEQAS